jgi:hypothetical protein
LRRDTADPSYYAAMLIKENQRNCTKTVHNWNKKQQRSGAERVKMQAGSK